MTKFVGIEYLIGNAFIYLTEKRFIELRDIYKYRRQMQNYWNSNDIDAIITGEVAITVYEFKDYFELKKEAGIIILKPEVTKEALKQRFVWYLKKDIALSFEEVAKNFS